MDFNKLIENIKKTNTAKTLWDSPKAQLELIEVTVHDMNSQNCVTFEAELYCDTEEPKEKLIEFCNALEWLRKQKDVINITPNIEGKLDTCIGSDFNEWQWLNCTVTFMI